MNKRKGPRKVYIYKEFTTCPWYIVSRTPKERWKRGGWVYVLIERYIPLNGVLSGTHESNQPACMWDVSREKLEPVSALELLTVFGRSIDSIVEKMR